MTEGQEIPFELGKSRLVVEKPVTEHDRFNCFPMSINKGRLTCCIQNERNGWWEDWNLEHTLAGIQSGFYRVVASPGYKKQ